MRQVFSVTDVAGPLKQLMSAHIVNAQARGELQLLNLWMSLQNTRTEVWEYLYLQHLIRVVSERSLAFANRSAVRTLQRPIGPS